METQPTLKQPTLQEKLAAMRNRIQQRQDVRDAAQHKDWARAFARLDQVMDEKFRQARSVIRHADFSDHGYMVTNGLVEF